LRNFRRVVPPPFYQVVEARSVLFLLAHSLER
jgi:hypothetical protein